MRSSLTGSPPGRRRRSEPNPAILPNDQSYAHPEYKRPAGRGEVRTAEPEATETVEPPDPNRVSHDSMLPGQSVYSTKNAPRLGKRLVVPDLTAEPHASMLCKSPGV